jgi:hypothetical protein
VAFDLRPLTLGELLDRSFSIYRHHFWLFVGIMALPSLLALGLGVLVAIMTPIPQITGSGTLETGPRLGMGVGGVLLFIGAALVATIIYFITYAIALGATTVAVSQIYMDTPGTIRSAYAPLRGKAGRLALLFLLVSLRLFAVAFIGLLALSVSAAIAGLLSPILFGVVFVFGLLAVAILSVWIGLRYAVAIPVAVLEDESATEAIGRSVLLTEGSLLRVFALALFSMMVTYAVLLIFQGPFAFVGVMAGPDTSTYFWANLAGTVSGAIGGAFTSPLMVVAFAVLYYDLRVRKEGLDLDVMLSNLRTPATETASPS